VMSHACLSLGDVDSGAWFAREAIAQAELVGEGLPLAFALAAEVRVAARTALECDRAGGDSSDAYQRVVDLGRHALTVCDEAGDAACALDVLVYLTLALGSLGRGAECESAYQRLTHLAAEVGLPSWKAAHMGRGRAYLRDGKYDEAVVCLEQASAEPSDDLLGARSSWVHADRAAAFLGRGDAPAAVAELRMALDAERAVVASLSKRLNESVAFGIRLRAVERRAGEEQQRATHDQLTSLLNRRGLSEFVADDPRATTMQVAMLDIDRFKGINDLYGHLLGDAVLAQVSEILRTCCREGDIVCRYSGDEFVLGIAGGDAAQAATAIERVRRAIEEHDWQAIVKGLRVTVSGGISEDSSGPWEERVASADAALYAAKRSGRNAVR
jgi:diguanylate cyclase (GGDEF)-like protein